MVSFFRGMAHQYGRLDGAAIRATTERPWVQRLAHTELYDLLIRYYLNNGLYDELTLAYRYANITAESMRELRNPAHRVVEFHAAKIWPGDLPDALPIIDMKPAQVQVIHRVWRWSNWALKKQLAIRQFAIFGDLFIKGAEKESASGERKVFLQVIDPRHVTDFGVDALGHVDFIRIDVPQVDVSWEQSLMGDGHWRRQDVYWTEVWERDRVRIWKSSRGPSTPIERLGKPGAQEGEIDRDHGLGFVPVVWAPFRDIGEPRGLGAFTNALSKIDEANRMATRLHSLLFRHNEVTWVLSANMMDPSGRPLPAPQIGRQGAGGGVADGRQRPGDGTTPDSTVQIGGERMLALPGMSKIDTLIPHVDYNAALSILGAMLDELTSDLPELNYYSTRIKSNVSGTAMRFALADAIDRVSEARGNAEAALVRAHQIALTIGQRSGIPGFEPGKIGTYEAGDWEHRFAKRPVIQLSDGEHAQATQTWVGAGAPFVTAARKAGWGDADIEQMRADQLAELDFQAQLAAKQQEIAAKAEEAKAKLALQAQKEAAADQARLALEQQREAAALQEDQESRKLQRQLELQRVEEDRKREIAHEEQERDLELFRKRLQVQAEVEIAKQRELATLAAQTSGQAGT